MKRRRTKKAVVGKALSGLNRKLHDVRVLTVIICVILSVLVAIILGNLLGKKADDSSQKPGNNIEIPSPEGTESSGGTDNPEPEEPVIIKKAKDIRADFCEVDKFNDSYQSYLPAVSLTLRSSDGSLAYYSEVADKYSLEINGTASLDGIVSLAKSKNKYLSACFHLGSCEGMSDSERLVYRAQELALLEELAKSGVDDILIFGLDISEDSIDDSVRFVSEAKKLVGKTYLGIASSYNDVDSDGYFYSISRIYEVADFIAIDYSTYAEDEEGFSMALTHALYYHVRYYARALFTEKSDRIIASQKSLLAEKGIENHQIILRTAAG